MIRSLILIAAILPLAACDLNPVEGKPSQFQLHQERIAALEARAPIVERERVEVRVVEYVVADPVAPVADVVADIVVEPVVEPVVEVEPPPPAPEPLPEPEPVCQPIFRVVECP